MLNLQYPNTRLRRLRGNSVLRNLTQENQLSLNDLIYPVFVIEGQGIKTAINKMPGQFVYSIDKLIEELQIVTDLGIQAIALFPNISNEIKDNIGSDAHNSKGLIPKAIDKIKQNYPHLLVIADVALDPYTSHGNDGIIDGNNYIINDETVEALVKQTLCCVKAGADIVAPSDMMDGRVKAMRHALENNNFKNTVILSYAAKYASNFYGPFREAVGSGALLKTDKKQYQMNIANSNEALYEVAMDIQEGADIVMIKPGMPYLDIISKIKNELKVPTFAYQVSGEYSMLQSAIQNNMLCESVIEESLLCFKRAGADAILTYFAVDIAKKIK